MVGSRRNGTMNDNDNEGWPGYTISQVHEKAKAQYYLKPNLVLINAGTNDCTQREEDALVNAQDRMKLMVRDIFDNIEDVTVILSGLLPNTDRNDCTKVLNDQYGTIVADMTAAGRKIIFADTWQYFTFDDLADTTHPDDEGYRKLAAVWWLAVTKAINQGFITEALDNGVPVGGSSVCDKHPGEYTEMKKAQRGSGGDDGPYKHKGESQGFLIKRSPIEQEHKGKDIFWADLDGDGIDEMIWYRNPDGTPGFYEVTFGVTGQSTSVTINVWDKCRPKGVRWGDVNGDGLDDFICIGPEGDMYVSINRGTDYPQGAPAFEYMGTYFNNPRDASSQTHVRLGDIDGDGRLDYCLIAGNGDISCWRNGWINDMPAYWQPFGVVFSGKNKGNIDGVRLVDINGDHRADWLYVNDDGSVDTYINNRGHDKSLRPDWSNSGRTHGGMGEKGARDRVQFARLTKSGRADYVVINYVPIKGVSEVTEELHWWRNDGAGGTRLKADGNFYCDMTGDGRDDYIWVSTRGGFQIFRNINDPPNWGQEGWVFEKEWPRKDIRIADIDGDGKCDIVFLLEDGTVPAWFRNGYSDGKWSFDGMGGIEGLPPCSQRNGVGLFDLAVRFADLNNDRKADRLCIDPDGRTFAYLSKSGGGYRNMGQVKKPEGKDRANIRYVDVNGDGKSDMLWLDKFGGEAEVWYNEKEESAPDTASSMTWRPGGKAYLQSARGEAMHFADLDGSGRADVIDVSPRTNEAYAYYARLCGGGGGDDGEIRDPQLPPIREPSQEEFFPDFPRFFAMGDSYSAGIGAGASWNGDNLDPQNKCHRTEGAYSYQLWQNDPHLYRNEFAFISCTGALAKHILTDRQHSRRPQLEILRSDYGADSYAWGTLSVGGNDAGFSNIITFCLVVGLPWMCDRSINKSLEKIRGDALSRDLENIYKGILDTAQTSGFTLIVTGYAQFFNEETEFCNGKSLNTLPGVGGPTLPRGKRSKLNQLVIELNNLIKTVINRVNAQYAHKFVRFLDTDPLYNGHRFCDVDAQGNELQGQAWRKSAWFLTPRCSDVGDATSFAAIETSEEEIPGCPDDLDEGNEFWALCQYARELQKEPNNPDLVPRGGILPESIMQMLHPKTVAHTAIRQNIRNEWFKSGGWGENAPR